MRQLQHKIISKDQIPLEILFAEPHISIAVYIHYFMTCAKKTAEACNKVSNDLCDLAISMKMNSKIDTQKTEFSLANTTVVMKSLPENRRGSFHAYMSYVATGLRGGLTLELAHEFALKAIERLKDEGIEQSIIKLTPGTYSKKTNSISMLMVDQKSELVLYEQEPASGQGEGRYKLEYPVGSPYDEAFVKAYIMANC